MKRVIVDIDPSSLKHNLTKIREITPKSKILAIVKSNAYGHGLREIVTPLKDVDGFGVSNLQEGLCLRNKLNIDKTIVLLNGFSDENELKVCAENGISCVIHHWEQYVTIANCSLRRPLKIWLKVDTGMNRLGFSLETIFDIWDTVRRLPHVSIDVLMTHLHSADTEANSVTSVQASRFQAINQYIKLPTSISNSAGILGFKEIQNDWVRPGIMLYGVSPFSPFRNSNLNLKPVMQFRSVVLSLRNCRKGDTIGYGGTWCCPEDMPVGIVAVGYSNGYPASAPSGTPILVRGIRTQTLGRVCMEMLTVDLRPITDPKIGDQVLLWGHGLPVEEIAHKAQINVYELLVRMRGNDLCSE